MMSSRYVLAFAAVATASGCMVGPDYKRPPPADPPSLAFKETTGPVVGAAASFQPAMPRDAIDRGPWWSMYDDHDARPAGGADRHLQPDLDPGRGGLSPGARAGAPGCLRPLSHGHGRRRLHPERQRQRFQPRHPGHRGQCQLGQRRPVQRRPQFQLGDRPVGPHPSPGRKRFGGGPGLGRRSRQCAAVGAGQHGDQLLLHAHLRAAHAGSTRRRWRPTRARSRSCRTSSMPAS